MEKRDIKKEIKGMRDRRESIKTDKRESINIDSIEKHRKTGFILFFNRNNSGLLPW